MKILIDTAIIVALITLAGTIFSCLIAPIILEKLRAKGDETNQEVTNEMANSGI